MVTKAENDFITEFTPLEKTEKLYDELVEWYGEADKKEIRAAAKLLMVALHEMSNHEGARWHNLVMEYVNTLRFDPEKFEKMLEANRGELKHRNSDYLQ